MTRYDEIDPIAAYPSKSWSTLIYGLSWFDLVWSFESKLEGWPPMVVRVWLWERLERMREANLMNIRAKHALYTLTHKFGWKDKFTPSFKLKKNKICDFTRVDRSSTFLKTGTRLTENSNFRRGPVFNILEDRYTRRKVLHWIEETGLQHSWRPVHGTISHSLITEDRSSPILKTGTRNKSSLTDYRRPVFNYLEDRYTPNRNISF